MKQKNKKIIWLALVIAIANSNSYNFLVTTSATSLSEQKQELTNQLNQTKDDLNSKEEEQSSVLAEIKKLDLELALAEQELEILENELLQTQENLAISEQELKDAQEQRLEQYESLKERINVMYKYGDMGYLEILLNAKGFGDFFKRVEYINYIMNYDQTLLERYQDTEDFIALKVEQIKTEKANIEVLVKKSDEKREETAERLEAKQNLGIQIASEASTLEQQILDLEAESDKVQKLIEEEAAKAAAEAAAKAAAEAEAAAKAKATTSSNQVYSSSSSSTSKLAHPVPAYSSSPFNDSYGPRTNPISGKSEVHAGLDLKATYGVDIVAAASGTVTYATYNNGGYGYMVMIDHGGGMTTLYAHNARLVVSKGQTVQRGQVIAKAGSTGYSTGVHCHFEVRINGSHTNPVPYLR
ncbi:MAG: peptidoglycan DD-metalloendopeptidase family protein [bacterium]